MGRLSHAKSFLAGKAWAAPNAGPGFPPGVVSFHPCHFRRKKTTDFVHSTFHFFVSIFGPWVGQETGPLREGDSLQR